MPIRSIKPGARGLLVQWIQSALVENGALIEVDGIFGRQTSAALASHLGQGTVDSFAAAQLGIPFTDSMLVTNLVNFFEGSSYDSIFGAYDAGILTHGFFGMTLGGGSLIKYLRDLKKITNAPRWAACYRDNRLFATFSAALDDYPKDADFREALRGVVPKSYALSQEWRTFGRMLANLPGAAQLQHQIFHRLYYEPARKVAASLGIAPVPDSDVADLRGVALLVDIHVQQGRLRQRKGGYSPNYNERLIQIAEDATKAADEQWRGHVRERRFGVAEGNGTYRGQSFDLKNFGLVP
jgi:hypothetical protein